MPYAVAVNAELFWLGIAVAVAAAVRSTWSPCGHSMLTKINPMGEASRGHRFGVTAVWFVAGAVAGGFTLGLGAAVLAVLVESAQLPTSAAFGATAVLALLAATVDTRLLRFGPPFHRRQVNDTWIGRYRSGVYALGFGWQLGVGVATYIMTAAVFLMVAFAALTGSVLAALVIGVAYGSVRGIALLIGARVTSPASLRSLLAGFEHARRAGPPRRHRTAVRRRRRRRVRGLGRVGRAGGRIARHTREHLLAHSRSLDVELFCGSPPAGDPALKGPDRGGEHHGSRDDDA